MQTITYDPATHVLVSRDRMRDVYNAMTPAQIDAIEKRHNQSHSNPVELHQTDCREALKWTAAALDAIVKFKRVQERDTIKLGNDEHKTIGEILDMANAALGDKS